MGPEEMQEQAKAKSWEYYLTGNKFRQENKWEKALACYAEAIALDKDSPACHAREMLLNILNYRCKDLYNP